MAKQTKDKHSKKYKKNVEGTMLPSFAFWTPHKALTETLVM